LFVSLLIDVPPDGAPEPVNATVAGAMAPFSLTNEPLVLVLQISTANVPPLDHAVSLYPPFVVAYQPLVRSCAKANEGAPTAPFFNSTWPVKSAVPPVTSSRCPAAVVPPPRLSTPFAESKARFADWARPLLQ